MENYANRTLNGSILGLMFCCIIYQENGTATCWALGLKISRCCFAAYS